MANITLRAAKDSPLTHNEVDANFNNLNTDKLDTAGIALGSAASPTLKFTGDGNTGIYSPGADQVAISTNGTGRLFVDASGRVGVATANPLFPLDVAGNTRLRNNLTVGNLGVLAATESIFVTGGDRALYLSGATSSPVYLRAGNPAVSGNLRELDLQGSDVRVSTGATTGTSVTERLRITSDGKVGLGTSSPAEKLHIEGAGTQTIRLRNSTTGSAASPQSTFIQFYGHLGSGGVEPRVSIEAQDRRSSVSGGFLNIATANSSNTLVNALHIDNAQRVGVGTTPVAPLDIATGGSGPSRVIFGQTSDNPYIDIYRSTGSGSDFAGFRLSTPSVYGELAFSSATGNTIGSHSFTERARIDSSGRLLVGTSSARAIATQSVAIQNEGTSFGTTGFSTCRNSNDIYGPYIHFGKTRGTAVGSNTLVSSGDDLGGLIFGGGDGTDVNSQAAYILCQVDGTPGANDMPGRLVFSTTADGASSPTERMRINSAGERLLNCSGISGDAPNNQGGRYFQINGNEKVRGGSTSGTAADTVFQFYHGTKTSADGSITVSTTATAYNTTSDYRRKENQVAITDGIKRLIELKPYRFNFIGLPSHVVDGFFAHEVQDIVPEAITGEKDAVDDDGNPIYQGIDQSKLVPLLTAALQEAIARIETLEQQVATLLP